MLRFSSTLTALFLFAATPALALNAPTLRGSPASMVQQNRVAKANDYTFLRTPSQVRKFADEGYLVRVESEGALKVASGVSFPYARPELHTFLGRLAEQYRDACGESLVVTSLTRPRSDQPGNSHPLSVHPAGMAADLRISQSAGCRSWLEATLLSLERKEVLDVTRERRPPHYHIAVFPEAYMEYVRPMLAAESAARDRQPAEAATRPVAEVNEVLAEMPAMAAGFAAKPAGEQTEERGGFRGLAGVIVLYGALAATLVRRKRAGAAR